MKFFLVFAFLFVAVVADVKHLEKVPQILRQSQQDPSADGSYRFDFETENQIAVQEVGSHKEQVRGEVGPALKVGSVQYISPEGHKIFMTYEADENGFRPKGDHIPAIPAYVTRALEFIQQQEALGKKSKF